MGKNKINIAPAKHIKLDVALRVVNDKGCILQKNILNCIKPDRIVRISMHVSRNSPYDCRQTSDSPYVKVLEIKEANMLGEILSEYRTLPDSHYPLLSRERVWFCRNNIIEVPTLTAEEEQKYCTKEYVAYTGPLETIDLDIESETDSESDPDSDSSESDADRESVELQGKNKNAPIPRGRPYN